MSQEPKSHFKVLNEKKKKDKFELMTNASRKQYQKYVLNVADDQEGIANIKEPSKFSLEDLRLK